MGILKYNSIQLKIPDIKNITNRYLIVIFVLIISSVLIHLLTYNKFYRTEEGLAHIVKIPLEIGGWHGQDIFIEDRIFEILETKSILQRKYSSDQGYEVLLTIVYYPETKVDFHAPEACFSGQGISISKSEKTLNILKDGMIFELKINQLIKQQMNSENLIYYFYKADNFFGSSYIKLRFSLALNKFLSNEKNGALIIVSSMMKNQDTKKESEVLQKFIQDIFPFMASL
jgi:EpsI family protein